MTAHFAYHDAWERVHAECALCPWLGALGDALIEQYATMIEVCCPRCERVFAVVSYPAAEGVLEAAAVAGRAVQMR